MPQPMIEFGGPADGPLLHIAPANGFVPETYLPMLRPLMSRYRSVCLPPRALWDDGPPPELDRPQDWQPLAEDLLAGFEHYGLEDMIAVGHSFGGVATMLAAIKAPQRFKAIILLDPTILQPNVIAMMASVAGTAAADLHPLVQATARRRRDFDSVQDCFTHFRQRTLFVQWSDEVLWLYAEHGTVPRPEGGVTLRWPPEWESYYFSTGILDTWAYVPKLHQSVPTLIVAGAESDTFIPASAQAVAKMLPEASHERIAKHGHLFPQSAPEASAKCIQAWLQSQGLW